MFRYPCFTRQARGELSAIIIADSSGFVKQKFAKLEGIFLEPMEKMLRDMVRQLREEVMLWRIISFILAAAVIISLFL